jgi:hypothetical protein
MKNDSLLGPWIRRFLLEHLVAERNLSRNTQRSYRDTLCLLLPRLALPSRTYRPTPYGTSSRTSKKSGAAASQLATRGCQPYTPLHTLSGTQP